jgi:large subunit ribosomal protein L21
VLTNSAQMGLMSSSCNISQSLAIDREDSLKEVCYMYAIVRTGGKQYQVACGDQVRVEKLEGNIGDSIDLSDVLMVVDGDSIKVGQPVLENAKVTAKIAEQGRAKKIIIFKKKRRQGYRLKRGHRQSYTALKIEAISA